MRNQSIQTEMETNVGAEKILRPIHTHTLAIAAAAVMSLLAQSALAGSAEPVKGAALLLNQSKHTTVYDRLPSEREIPELAGLATAHAALPETLVLASTTRQGEPPVRIAIHQRGAGTHERVVVMIHGLMADHEAWRYVTGPLGTDFDLWLVDLPGCGASDKPDPKSLGPDGYSPTAMGERLFQALEECLAGRTQPPRMVIAAHSLGGMTALRMMGDPDLRRRHPAVLKQIDGMVLLAPCDVAVNQEIQVFMTIEKIHGYEAAIGHVLGMVKAAAAKADLSGYCLTNRATRETSGKLAGVLTRGEDRRAAQAMVRQAVPWLEKEHRPDWDGIERLEAHYSNIDVPCLILWGQRDETLPVNMGYKLSVQIPGAKLIVLPHCMHSIELECPTACVEIIRKFDSEVQLARNAKAKPATLTAQINLTP